MQLFSLNKSLHKWLSLIVGIQLLIWLSTGLYFNLMDHQKATGNENRQRVIHGVSEMAPALLPISQLDVSDARSVNLLWVLDTPVYRVVKQAQPHRYQKKQVLLFHAISGEHFKLHEEVVSTIASRSYKGKVDITDVSLLQPPIAELPREENAVWRVSLNDANETNVYIDNTNGRVVEHINDDRRLRDLMFKLHFMDYFNTGGFNHWLIILFAIGTLTLSVTGVTWVIQLYKTGALSITAGKAKQSLSVFFTDSGSSIELTLISEQNLLEGLAQNKVFLPSSCGGGGTCGKCVVQTDKTSVITPTDREHLSSLQLAQGYRLGCQHQATGLSFINIDHSAEGQIHELEVTSSSFVTPFIKEVKFKATSGQTFSYQGGAHMQFLIPPAINPLRPENIPDNFSRHWQSIQQGEFAHNGGVRHYSLANFDRENNELVFNIRWQTGDGDSGYPGIGSGYLCSLNTGDKVLARGPFIDFNVTRNAQSTKVFIGAGSGLAPLKSMLFEQLKEHCVSAPFYLLYGARSEDDLAYRNAFDTLAQQHSNFQYIPTLSQPSEHWQGHQGYVQQVLNSLLEKIGTSQSTEYYLCGPAPMMAEVEQILVAANVPSTLIFKETFNR